MANVLRGLPDRLARVPADALTGAGKAIRAAAEKRGGRVAGVQLTTDERERKVRPGAASAVIAGIPAGYWSWREYGTEKHRIAAKRSGGRMAGGGLRHPITGPVIHPGITPPPQQWTAAMRDAERVTETAAEDALERAVG